MWYYRVCRKYTKIGVPYWCIVEFYPRVPEYGKLWSEEPEAPIGENKKDVIECLEMMLQDAKKHPVLYDNQNKPKASKAKSRN